MKKLYTVGKNRLKTLIGSGGLYAAPEKTDRANCGSLFLTFLVMVMMGVTNAFGQTQTQFLTSGTSWTVPAGVYSVTVECWGGGGCGSRSTSNGCARAGGGGGAYSKLNTFTVTPGSTVSYSIGSGGVSNTANLNGGDTWFSSAATVMAKGGTGLANDVTTGGAGGQASSSIGDVKFSGGNGGNGASCSGSATSGGGGGGAGSTAGGNNGTNGANSGGTPVGGAARADFGGAGGNGLTSNGVGNSGFIFGGGGGGGKRASTGAGGDRSGGSGAPGGIRITYCIAPQTPSAGSDVTICSGSSTVLTATATANTTIFSEDFERTPNNFFIYGGWSSIFIGGGYNAFLYSTTGAISGTSLTMYDLWAGVINSYNKGQADQLIAYTTAPINATSYTNLRLNFQWRCAGEILAGINYDYFRVTYSTNGTAWTDLPTIYRGQSTTQTVSNLDLSVLNNTSFYLGFRWINDNSSGSNPPMTVDNISITGTPTISYAWSPGTGLSATNVASPTASPTSQTTYTVTATQGSCTNPNTDAVIVNVNSLSTAPLSVSGTNEICVGGSTTLTTVDGSLGTNAVDVWYEGGCANEAFSQDWGSQPYSVNETTVNSVIDGILTLNSIGVDPMIFMPSVMNVNPVTHKFINIRYRVTSGSAGSAEIFFYNPGGSNGVSGATQTHAQSVALISDNTWRIATIDMTGFANWTSGGNIIGWRYDWAAASGVTMELDFITLSDRPIIGTGTTLTVSPTSTTTYFTAKKGLCNVTSCASRTVTVNADPTVTISGAANVCAGQTVTLTANVSGGSGSVTGYQWRRNSGNIATGNPYTTSNALSAGSYSYDVSVTQSGSGCASTFSTTVSADVNALPTPSIAVSETSGTTNNDGTTCSGATVTLTASGGSTYSWNNGLGTGNPKTPAPSGTTTYVVTATDGNNCSATAQSVVTVNNNPSASASASTPLCEGGTINFAAGGGTSYSWSGPVSYSATGASPTRTSATLAMAGAYQVTVTDANNCSASTNTNAVVINANPTGSVSYESCAGIDGNTTIKISGSGGTAPYNFRLLPGSFGASNTFAINNGSTNNFFEVRDNANCTSSTITHNATHGTPTVIATNTTTATACSCNGENRDVYLSSGNNLVAIINDNGENLGTVNATIYNQFGAVIVNGEAAMDKSWTLSSSLQPNTNVTLRLPFITSSYTGLISAAAATATLTDDISGITDIGATRYSGPNENGVYDASSGTATFLTQSGNNSIFGGSYVSFSSPGFSEWWLHGSLYGVGLPVELISFTATAINNEYIRLDWATALEINNDGFEIERSTDAQNWTKIGWVNGNDNSTITQTYAYNDVTVAQGVTYYYRLRQVDNDGQFEYSDVVSTTLTKKTVTQNVIVMFPNPVTEKLNISLEGIFGDVTITVTNVLGEAIKSFSETIKNKATLSVPFAQFADGYYFVTVRSANGIYTQKIVKARN